VNHTRAQDRLSAYLEHDLGDSERAALDAHLAACPRCAADLEDLRGAVDLLRRLPDPEPPPFLSTRVMARIAAGETRVPAWRRLLEQLGAPAVVAPLAAALAALAVFTFAAPPGTETAVVAERSEPRSTSVAKQEGPAPERSGLRLRQQIVGDREPSKFVFTPQPDPQVLRGGGHPHSILLAEHFNDPVQAVAYQPK